MAFTNGLDPATPLMRLRTNPRNGRQELAPAIGMQQLVDVLNNLGQEINQAGLTQNNLAQSLLDLIGLQPLTGYPTLTGLVGTDSGNSYVPISWGPMPARYVEVAIGSEAWTRGAEIPTNATRYKQYVAITGTTGAGGTFNFGPEVAIRVPANFKGWSGNAISWDYTIEDVSGYATNDTITAGLLVEATIPGFAAVNKTRAVNLTAPGPFTDGGVYSTLSVTKDSMGDGWRAGDLLRVTPYFTLVGAAGSISVDLRWADLRINWR